MFFVMGKKSVLISSGLHFGIKNYCVSKGIFMGQFIEDAIKEKYNRDGGNNE